MDDGAPLKEPPQKFLLADLKTGQDDPRGRKVLDILWAVDEFKIYKTASGINPFFSDIPEQARSQKVAYLALGADIAAFNHLINSLKPVNIPFTETEMTANRTARDAMTHYERELARCIAQAFLTPKDTENTAKQALANLRARLEAKIANRARIVHLLINVILVALLFAVIYFLDKVDYDPIFSFNIKEISLAAIMGSVGALFSTTVRLQLMSVDPMVGQFMHWIYGSQRVLVGVLGAIIIYFGFKSGIVNGLLQPVSDVTAPTEIDLYWLAFISVLAGFSERLVPNLLDGKTREIDDRNAATAEGDQV